jgi:erythromycin esterase-like protein
MKLAQWLSALWKSLFKWLAEPSGRLQEKDSLPFFGFDPQVDEE